MVDVAALVQRVAELEIVVTELTARIRQLEVQAPVTAASATPSEAGLSSAAAGPAASEVLVASSPPVTFTPVPSDTGSLPDAKVRHYALVEPNAYDQRGVYRSYSRFSDAVRGHSVPWNGRGRFPWASGASGKGFNTRREAEAFFIQQLGLEATSSPPHWA